MGLGYAILVLVIYVLAVARLTRLVNADTILDRPRLWFEARRREAERIMDEQISKGAHPDAVAFWGRREARWRTAFYFVQCPWCIGMWMALVNAIVPVLIMGWPWWTLLPVALAASHLVGVCARLADTEETDIEDDAAR